jgi:hypothetical protein
MKSQFILHEEKSIFYVDLRNFGEDISQLMTEMKQAITYANDEFPKTSRILVDVRGTDMKCFQNKIVSELMGQFNTLNIKRAMCLPWLFSFLANSFISSEKFKTFNNIEKAKNWLVSDVNDDLQIQRMQNIFYSYKLKKDSLHIPGETRKIIYKSSDMTEGLRFGSNLIWVFSNSICLFPDTPTWENYEEYCEVNVKVTNIPIERIEYYHITGEVFRENKISGGGGGGSSIKGAVVGGVIAGEAGAIIGSRKKVEPIQSEIITHDTRETTIKFFDENDKRCKLIFDHKSYEVLKDLIPEKEYDIVSSIKSENIIKKLQGEDGNKTVFDQIRELAKLKEDGILNNDEFIEKKRVLLEKIK